MKKLIELTKEEIEQMLIDKDLFMKLFPLFDCMSKRGKDTTIQTLLMYMLKEEIRKWISKN